MVTPVKVVRETSFIRRNNHELEKIIKSLTKESQRAIDRLSDLCDDPDPKIAVKAIEILLNTLQSMTDQKNKDSITRLIAQFKLGGARPLEADDDTPLIRFDEIQNDD